MSFMTKLLTDTTLLIGLTPLSPISQIFMEPGTPRQPRCELEHVMTGTVTGTISQKMYNGHKQTLVGIDNRQLPQSATEQCPIVV